MGADVVMKVVAKNFSRHTNDKGEYGFQVNDFFGKVIVTTSYLHPHPDIGKTLEIKLEPDEAIQFAELLLLVAHRIKAEASP